MSVGYPDDRDGLLFDYELEEGDDSYDEDDEDMYDDEGNRIANFFDEDEEVDEYTSFDEDFLWLK